MLSMIESIEPGLVVGKLTVLKEIEPGIHGSRQWYCQCECGNYVVSSDYVLRHKTMKSCGCARKGVPEIFRTAVW